MDSSDNKDKQREEDKLRVDVLAKTLEIYRIMAHIFFKHLSRTDKVDALTEAAEKIREEILTEEKDDV